MATLAAPALAQAGGAPFFEDERSAIPRTPFEAKDAFAADLNQDGVPDLVLADGRIDRDQEQNGILLSDGQGQWHHAPVAVPGPALGIGDLDGDGDLDVVYPDHHAIQQNGAWALQPRPQIAHRAVVRDFDGDGVAEVRPLSADERGHAFDADGDGDLDLCVTGPAGADLLLNQAGVLSSAPAGGLPYLAPGAMLCAASGDVDGDGDQDLLIGTNGYGVRLLHNQGNGTFVPALVQPQLAGGVVYSVAIGDVTGDGLPDLVAGTHNDCRIYRQYSSQVFLGGGSIGAQGRTQAIALVDLDLDGDLDLLQGAATWSPSTLLHVVDDGVEALLHWNDGPGTFRTGRRYDLPSGSFVTDEAAALGDLNNDGCADVVVSGSGSRVYLSDRRGSFVALPAAPAGGKPRLGDIDNDGDLDLLVFGPFAYSTWRNNSGGYLATWSGIRPIPNGAIEVELGDVNGDGNLDLLIATTGVDELWLGSGTGYFTPSPGWFTTSTTPRDPHLVDIDNDGDLDVLDVDYVQHNTGTSFVHTAFATSLAGYARMAVADLDDDGFVDAAVATTCGVCGPFVQDPPNGLLYNDGTGNFTAAAWNGTDLQGSHSVGIGDIDQDGRPDVLFGNGSVGEPQDYVAFNLGNRQWQLEKATAWDELDDTRKVLMADFDRDGDPDFLALAVSGRSTLYRNRTRQLRAPLHPRLGRDFVLEVHGAEQGAWLWLSLSPADLPTPYGRLGIGPAALGSWAILPAPSAAAPARQHFLLPGTPSLAGETVYVQAFDFANARLSNTLRETFVAW